jgi:hypothetical protein
MEHKGGGYIEGGVYRVSLQLNRKPSPARSIPLKKAVKFVY